MQRNDTVTLNEYGAKNLREQGYAGTVGMRGKVASVVGDSAVAVVWGAQGASIPTLLAQSAVDVVQPAKQDIVEAVQDAVRDHAEQLRPVDFGEVLIKIQDGRPVFLDITYKSKLK